MLLKCAVLLFLLLWFALHTPFLLVTKMYFYEFPFIAKVCVVVTHKWKAHI